MTDNTLTSIDHEDLMSQLPWLVNGTLDEQEEKVLRAHLGDCSICQDEYASLSTLFNLVSEETEQDIAVTTNARASLARMQARIANEPRHWATLPFHRLRTFMNDFFGNNGRPLVALASVSILMLSLLVIQRYVLNPELEPNYQVLSNQEQASEIKFAVTFDESVTAQQSATVLTDVSQQIGMKTRIVSQNQESVTFAATGEESAPHLDPQQVTEMMELMKNRVEVLDVQLVP